MGTRKRGPYYKSRKIAGASPWPTLPLADPSRLPGRRSGIGGQAGRPESGSGTGGQACEVLFNGNGHAQARPLRRLANSIASPQMAEVLSSKWEKNVDMADQKYIF